MALAVAAVASAAAAGCTLTVGTSGRGLVEAGGVLRLCPCGSHYVIVAWVLPLQLVLHACSLDFALAAAAAAAAAATVAAAAAAAAAVAAAAAAAAARLRG